jgi:hypothetical protein
MHNGHRTELDKCPDMPAREVWSALFGRQRRLILSSDLNRYRGHLPREKEVIHLIGEHFLDLSNLPRSVGDRNEPLSVRYGRGDGAKAGTRGILRTESKGMFDHLRVSL